MKLRYPKKIKIISDVFNIKYDNAHNGGSFDFSENLLVIGIRDKKENEDRIFQVICHEVFEVIAVISNTRYDDPGNGSQSYKFFMSHKEFQTNIEMFSSVISQFVK